MNKLLRIFAAALLLAFGPGGAVQSAPPAIITAPGPSVSAFNAKTRPSSNKVILVGHSMNDQSLAQVPGGNNTRVSQQWNWAWPAWVSALSKGRYVFPEETKFAVSGSLISDIGDTVLTSATAPSGNGVGKTQLQNAIESPATIVAYWSGRNDRANSVPIATSIAKATRDINALTAAGKTVVMISEIPAGSAASSGWTSTSTTAASCLAARLTGQNLAYQLQWVDWQTRQAPALWPGKVFAVDIWQDMVDMGTGATPGDVVVSRTQDCVHTAAPGAYLQALRVRHVLDGLGLPQSYPAIGRRGDAYDATNNPAGNLLGDIGTLTASSTAWSGTFGSTVNFAGVRPAIGSQFGSTPASSSGNVTGSFVTTSTGTWWQMAVATTFGAGTNPSFSVAPVGTSTLLSSVSSGDVLRAYGEFEIDSGCTGLTGVSLILQRNLPLVSGVAKYDLTAQTFGNESSGVLDTVFSGLAAPLAGTWNGNTKVTIDGAELGIFVGLQVNWKGGVTANCNIRVRNLAVRKAA